MRFQIKYQTLENTPIVLKLNFVEERGTEDMREGEIESYCSILGKFRTF